MTNPTEIDSIIAAAQPRGGHVLSVEAQGAAEYFAGFVRNHRKAEDDLAEARERLNRAAGVAYRRGLSAYRIAQMTGFSAPTISRILRDQGIDRLRGHDAP